MRSGYQNNVYTGLCSDIAESIGGGFPGPDGFLLTREVKEPFLQIVPVTAADQGSQMPLIPILQWNEDRKRTGSMARSHMNRKGRVAQREFLTVRRDHVLLRLQVGRNVFGLLDDVPVRLGQHDA